MSCFVYMMGANSNFTQKEEQMIAKHGRYAIDKLYASKLTYLESCSSERQVVEVEESTYIVNGIIRIMPFK